VAGEVKRRQEMDALIRDVHYYLFLFLVITALFLLSSCDTDFLKKSAQEATGGVGAGLSEYQVLPIP